MNRLIPGVGDALLVIDMQCDSPAGGSPEVPEGDAVIPPHCVAGSHGAAFAASLALPRWAIPSFCSPQFAVSSGLMR